MKFESLQTLSQILIWIGAIIAAYGAFGSYYFGKKADGPPLTRQEIDEVVSQQLDKLYSRLQSPAEGQNKKYPGFSFHAVVAFHDVLDNRRKYVLDIGNEKKGRLSIYFDASNFFTLSFLDVHAEQHVVRVPVGREGVPLEEFIYITCEIGVMEKSTFLRVLVDGNQVGSLDLPFPLKPMTIDFQGGVLGANLNGNSGARFDMVQFGAYSSTVTSKEIENLLGYIKDKPAQQYISFSSSQWMRFGEPGEGLKVEAPDAAPVFRKL